jgi:nucleoside-diphosphate-sugar epimerase
MYHRTPLAADLVAAPNVRPVNADLADPSTLHPAVDGADVVIHFAGRLFAPRPHVDDACRPAVGNDLQTKHSDGGRGAMARTSPAAVCLASAHTASVAVDRRFPARHQAAIEKPGIRGIYHVGDEEPVTVQQFLDAACLAWGFRAPMRVPYSMIYAAACACELGAAIARTPSPLTRDFVTLGRVPHWGDTRRARAELVPQLVHPTLASGLSIL